MTRPDLWKHYEAARARGDLELSIAYLELLLSRTLERLPRRLPGDAAMAELLRRRADRVTFARLSPEGGEIDQAASAGSKR
jgi:hypothetical protein